MSEKIGCIDVFKASICGGEIMSDLNFILLIFNYFFNPWSVLTCIQETYVKFYYWIVVEETNLQ